jgi:hypothetical protein
VKVFLSTSFSGKIDPSNGEVLPEFRKFVTQILESLRQNEGEAVCAMEQEGWKISGDPPEIGVQRDLQAIDDADVLLALIDRETSVGVQFELGYAVAKGKRVIIARASEGELAYFNQGIVSSGLATLISYDNVSMLLPQLALALNAPEEI